MNTNHIFIYYSNYEYFAGVMKKDEEKNYRSFIFLFKRLSGIKNTLNLFNHV